METLHTQKAEYYPGEIIGIKAFFGPRSRYAVYPIWTRFNRIEYFVQDTEQEDPETGLPAVIVQARTFQQAMRQVGYPVD